jgi:hypothetical protein
MALLQSIGIIDVFALCHSLYARQKTLGAPKLGIRYLPIDDDVLDEWQILKSFLGRCTRLIEERGISWELTGSGLRWFDPGAVVPWRPGTDDEIEVHIGIVTHPLSRLYAGIESYSISWGEVLLSVVPAALRRSEQNAGPLRTVSLVLTLQKPATTPDQTQSYQTMADPNSPQQTTPNTA